MGEIEFKAVLTAPYFTQAPPEMVAQWAESMLASREKTYRQLTKTIKTRKDFHARIGEPLIEHLTRFLGKTEEKTNEEMVNEARESLKEAARKYPKKIRAAYEIEKYRDSIKTGREWFAETWVKYIGPLQGYRAAHIKGLGPLAALALTGDRNLLTFLKETDKIIKGGPVCITAPEQAGKFSNALRRQIMRSGKKIISWDYPDGAIQAENKKLNELAEGYRLETVALFRPAVLPRLGRETVREKDNASHIDFVVREIFDKDNAGKKIKWLGLDIQVSRQ